MSRFGTLLVVGDGVDGGRLIDTMTGVVVLLGLDGAALRLNRAVLELAGRPQEDLAGVPLWALPIWADDERPRGVLRAAVRTAADGTPITVEASLAGGAVLRLTLRRIDGEAEPLLLAEGHDVTDYVALAARLAADDAQRRRRVHAVGHDLKSPLAVLMALADRAGKRDASAEDRAGLVRAARSIGDRIDELLDDARETDGETSPATPVDLARVVRDAVDGLAALARDRKVHMDVAAPRGCAVLADERRLESVVANLVGNALRFADTVVEVRLESLGSMARLTVGDDGPGVPARMREQVFERFSQGADVGRTGAAGLGLAIVRDVVTLHGGSIRLGTSELGGASFTVDLPRAGVRERRSASATPEAVDPFDAAPLGLGVVGADGHWERVNAPLAAMLGAPVRELVGQPAKRWMAPEAADALTRTLAGRAERFEVQPAGGPAHRGRRLTWTGLASRAGAQGDVVVASAQELGPPAVNRRPRHRTRQPV